MLSTPKKPGGRADNPVSEIASFKKVAYGFSPDEVNLYISSLRKQNLELKNLCEKLEAGINPYESAIASEQASKIDTLEKSLAKAEKALDKAERKAQTSSDKYLKEKELVSMLTSECARLGEEVEALNKKLAAGSKDHVKPSKAAPVSDPVETSVAPPPKQEKPIKEDASSVKPELKEEIVFAEDTTAETPAETVSEFADFEIPLTPASAQESEPANKKLQSFLETPIFEEEAAEEDDILSDLLVTSTPVSEPETEEIIASDIFADDVSIDDLIITSEPEVEVIADDEPIFEEVVTEQPAAEEIIAEPAAVEERRGKKPRTEIPKTDPVQDLSRAELKIQIVQEEPEDSYIIPEKYLKMIEDVENDDDDDFSYLLTDVDDINEEDDMDLHPVETAAVPSKALRPAPGPSTYEPPLPEEEQYTRYGAKPEDL